MSPKIKITDPFWLYYQDLIRNVVVPYQWDALNDRIPNAEPSGAVSNFKIAAGEKTGDFYGMVFQDSDIAKWLEAVAYLLSANRDENLENIADQIIDTIEKAQQPDGYLNTYFTIKEPNQRWTNLLECHELYCAGHMIEAGVAYYQATGKRKIFDVVIRLADCIYNEFGPEDHKIKGYDGHQEIELALMKLYEATGDKKYLQLCRYFLEERGKQPFFFDQEYAARGRKFHFGTMMIENKKYSQSHQPVAEQNEAVGHAVRFIYMLTGMAHLAATTSDPVWIEASKRLWNNMVQKQMYITGGIGSQHHGEAFTTNYDLPSDTAYAETCASVGLVILCNRMLQIDVDSQYSDTMERALYNGVLSGMSLDGKKFFYVNVLEQTPHICRENANYIHVKTTRQPWFGCACCPPNLARLIASIGNYVYTVKNDTVYSHLYIAGETNLEIDGNHVSISQETTYPKNGDIRFQIRSPKKVKFTMAVRIPNWCDRTTIEVNGVKKTYPKIKGYVYVSRTWGDGDTLDLKFSMPIIRMKAHPYVQDSLGKVALQRGPIVYCAEEIDNGENLHLFQLLKKSNVEVEEQSSILGIPNLKVNGIKIDANVWETSLYRHDVKQKQSATQVTLVPYFSWANRGEGEMRVWIRE